MHISVFPSSEPEENHVQIVRARTIYDRVNVFPIEFSGLRLHLLPINGSFNSVRVQLSQGLPHRRQLRRPCARVVNLAPEHQVRLTVHEKGRIAPKASLTLLTTRVVSAPSPIRVESSAVMVNFASTPLPDIFLTMTCLSCM